jgi:hypothetical protein
LWIVVSTGHAVGADTSPRLAYGRRLSRAWLASLVSVVGYLILSLGMWWNVWTTNPGRTTICGCGDSSFTLWFFEFAAHALRSGHNPFFTTLLWHPHGVNVLDDASQLSLGLLLAPVTWAGGAVLAMNVALALAPVASAVACYTLLDHWGLWRPAAFVGGFVYGFSPLAVMNLAEAHLVMGFTAAPPLIVLCLDKLLFRAPRRPVIVGIALGLLVTFQFFVSSEILLVTGMACAAGMAMTLIYAAMHRCQIGERWRQARGGLAAGLITSLVLLAYPVWFALDGPGHVAGPIYPNGGVAFSGATVRGFIWPTQASDAFIRYAGRIGGYQGPTISTQYFGVGIVVVVFVGLLVWRHDLRLRLFAAIGVVFAAFGLGSSPSGWRPWELFAHAPLVQNVIPVRLLLVTYLCSGVSVAIVADHIRLALPLTWGRCRTANGLTDAVTVAVLSIAAIPSAGYMSMTLPLTTQRVVIPAWFGQVAPKLGPHQVVLAIPVPFSGIQSSLTWQSESHLSFAMAGGDGPGSTPEGVGHHPLAQRLLAEVSASFSSIPVTPEGIIAVRAALVDWGVTRIVLPDQPELPAYDQPFSSVAAAVLITAALGQAPVLQARAWVWTGSGGGTPAAVVSTSAFEHCTTASRIGAAAACILGTPIYPR